MVEKAISTALMVIASIVATLALINAVVPAVGKGSSALLTANSVASERIKTYVEIVFATANTGDNTILFWAKNVGSTIINNVDASDVFLTTPTTVERIPYGVASGTPYWDYVLETSTQWGKAVTIGVTLNMASVSTGAHSLTMIVHNSASASKEFSV